MSKQETKPFQRIWRDLEIAALAWNSYLKVGRVGGRRPGGHQAASWWLVEAFEQEEEEEEVEVVEKEEEEDGEAFGPEAFAAILGLATPTFRPIKILGRGHWGYSKLF